MWYHTIISKKKHFLLKWSLQSKSKKGIVESWEAVRQKWNQMCAFDNPNDQCVKGEKLYWKVQDWFSTISWTAQRDLKLIELANMHYQQRATEQSTKLGNRKGQGLPVTLVCWCGHDVCTYTSCTSQHGTSPTNTPHQHTRITNNPWPLPMP